MIINHILLVYVLECICLKRVSFLISFIFDFILTVTAFYSVVNVRRGVLKICVGIMLFSYLDQSDNSQKLLSFDG